MGFQGVQELEKRDGQYVSSGFAVVVHVQMSKTDAGKRCGAWLDKEGTKRRRDAIIP